MTDPGTGVHRTCSGDDVRKCVERHAKPVLSSTDIKAFFKTIREDCFAGGNPEALEEQGACLPLPLGKDPRNGRVLEIRYKCSDVCPAYGGVWLVYRDVPTDRCCAVGGYPKYHPGGGYIGCEPREAPRAYAPRAAPPDGRWKQAAIYPCDRTKLLLEDGAIIERWDLKSRK